MKLLWTATIAANAPGTMVFDRERLLDAVAPDRECSDSPGLYTRPNGDRVVVAAREVGYYVSDETPVETPVEPEPGR